MFQQNPLTLFGVALISFAVGCGGVDPSSIDSSAAAARGREAAAGSGAACVVSADCPATEECEDRICKSHGGGGADDAVNGHPSGGGADDPADLPDDNGGNGADDVADLPDDNGTDATTGTGTACTFDADCATGNECEDGFCQPHGGDDR